MNFSWTVIQVSSDIMSIVFSVNPQILYTYVRRKMDTNSGISQTTDVASGMLAIQVSTVVKYFDHKHRERRGKKNINSTGKPRY